jgi:hypothetical protein
MLQMSSDHIEFHRALNASALLFSIIHFFPASIPDFIALECEELGRHERLCLIQEDDYKHLFEDENYFGQFIYKISNDLSYLVVPSTYYYGIENKDGEEKKRFNNFNEFIQYFKSNSK